MLYLFLICYDPARERRPGEPASLQPQHAALEAALKDEGVFVAGAALMPPAIVPPVIVRDGKRVTTEGPFTEARELIGGFFIIECSDDDDAARQAARIPADSRSWIRAQQIPLYHAGSGPRHDAGMQALEETEAPPS